MTADHERLQWWKAEEGDVNEYVLKYVYEVERTQSYLFERFYRLRCLYDPYFEFLSGYGDYYESRRGYAEVTENVIASNVDTVTAVIAAADIRPVFDTDDGDYTTQRKARHLEWYSEGIAKMLGLQELSTRAFKEAALVGTGLIKVTRDWVNDQPRAEIALADDIVVDEAECRRGRPMQMAHRVFVDRDELIAAFPSKKDEIIRAQGKTSRIGLDWSLWAGYRPMESNQVVVVESWRLGSKKDEDGKLNGRHTLVIDGCDLVDEEWPHDFFPFAVMRWADRTPGFYGVGGAERIAGHQRRLNKMNWQEDRIRDQYAMPTTYVNWSDKELAVKTRNQLGNIAVYRGQRPPVTVFPQAANVDQVERRRELKASGYEEFGVSQLAATARKPAGLESGAALREYRDSTTQRFATQEKAHERMYLDAVWLALNICKELGSKAPVIVKKTPSAPRKIEWSKVDMLETRHQLSAANTIGRTRAGRQQQVIEFAQAGIISQDEARRLMRHPDLARAMSIYTAAIENIEMEIEVMLDGERRFPEPYQNLQLGLWRVQMAYLLACNNNTPERIKENLRQWMNQASFVLNPPQAPVADPMAGELSAGEQVPQMPVAAPVEGAPQAALAPEAMNLVAG